MFIGFARFQVIGECHAGQIDEEAVKQYRLAIGSQDRELFIEFCLHLMLFQQPPQGSITLYLCSS